MMFIVVKNFVMTWALQSFFSTYLLMRVVALYWDSHGWGFTVVLVPIKSILSYSMAALLVALCCFLHGYLQGPNPPEVEHFLLSFE